MSPEGFPALALDTWQSTRDTLHGYCKVLGRIRRQLAPPQKHWWHISLRVTENGVSTAAIPAPGRNAEQFEASLDFQAHRLMITTTWGVWWEMPVAGQPPRVFSKQVLSALETLEVPLEIDQSDLDLLETPYDTPAVEAYGRALLQVNEIFNRFKAELPGETSQVQLWPHHFDLALTWFSGRVVPGVDPLNEELADEQLGFGFSTGDQGVPEPYFYATAYPWPAGITARPLPPGSAWHTSGWNGALYPYAALVESGRDGEHLLNFLRAAFLAGSSLMR